MGQREALDGTVIVRRRQQRPNHTRPRSSRSPATLKTLAEKPQLSLLHVYLFSLGNGNQRRGKKNDNENAINLIRALASACRARGLSKAPASAATMRATSPSLWSRKGALKRIKRREEVQELIKLGKMEARVPGKLSPQISAPHPAVFKKIQKETYWAFDTTCRSPF
jgi:hypothetical protein